MKTPLSCASCIIKQAINTARLATDDERLHRLVLDEVLKALLETKFDRPPNVHSDVVYKIAERVTGNRDPYRELKARSNREALALLPRFQRMLDESPDRLLTASKMVIAGNVIDFGIAAYSIDSKLADVVEEVLSLDLAIDDFEQFKADLGRARRILYLGDNAGEIVFDRLLVGEIRDGREVTYSVKSSPVINDATMEDARLVGMDKLVRVIETGNGIVGVDLERSSPEFAQAYGEADLIISKGQGNFEALSETDDPIYFFLRAKCREVAEVLGVDYLDIVLARNDRRWTP